MFPLNTSIYGGLPLAMFDYRSFIIYSWSNESFFVILECFLTKIHWLSSRSFASDLMSSHVIWGFLKWMVPQTQLLMMKKTNRWSGNSWKSPEIPINCLIPVLWSLFCSRMVGELVFITIVQSAWCFFDNCMFIGQIHLLLLKKCRFPRRKLLYIQLLWSHCCLAFDGSKWLGNSWLLYAACFHIYLYMFVTLYFQIYIMTYTIYRLHLCIYIYI